MNNKIVISIIVILVIVGGVFFFFKPFSKVPNNMAPFPNKISMANFAFDPQTITINKGDTVTWTNNDSVPHQIKGDTLAFASAPLSAGEIYSYTFNVTGTFTYHCAIHPSMTGTIIVK